MLAVSAVVGLFAAMSISRVPTRAAQNAKTHLPG
jgi:hypothetical protein